MTEHLRPPSAKRERGSLQATEGSLEQFLVQVFATGGAHSERSERGHPPQ